MNVCSARFTIQKWQVCLKRKILRLFRNFVIPWLNFKLNDSVVQNSCSATSRLVKCFKFFSTFMESEVILKCLKEPDAGLSPEQEESSQYFIYLRYKLILFSHLHLYLANGFFPSYLPNNTSSPMNLFFPYIKHELFYCKRQISLTLQKCKCWPF